MTLTIQEIIHLIQAEQEKFGITLYIKPTEAEIAAFENEVFSLPDDIKTFYRFCDGFESKEDMFRIIPLGEIMEYGRKKGPYECCIAEYMIYCDFWTLSINPNKPNEYRILYGSLDNLTMTNSFAEFLDRFLKGGVFDGLYEWKDQLVKEAQGMAANDPEASPKGPR